MIISEQETFRKLCHGDESAFEYFFKKYYERLYHYAFDILKDALAAEEIVEDIFLKMWEERSRIRIKSSPAAYFYRTAYNSCLNYIKHKKVADKYLAYQSQRSIADLEQANNSFPLSTLIEKEFEARLQRSLEKLPDQCRQIFMMSRLEGKRNQEIAENLQISVNTVKTQLLRALSKLRKDLKQFFVVLFFKK
jgi:RNA polymerase sigma-70 factor (ECF subfamily)